MLFLLPVYHVRLSNKDAVSRSAAKIPFGGLCRLVSPSWAVTLCVTCRALVRLNDVVFRSGAKLLFVGVQAGINFLTENLIPPDGQGYLNVGGTDEFAAPQHTLDIVWSDGPFFMQVCTHTPILRISEAGG